MNILFKNESKIIKYTFNIYCIYLLLQPLFDVLSNLYNYGYYTINFITYLKPLFVFGIFAFALLFIKIKGKSKYFFYYFLLAIYLVMHSYILYFIFVDNSVILHELRFCINIIYFVTMLLTLKILYNKYDDKQEFFKKLKNTLCLVIIFYLLLYLLAVVTNSSWLTYEFADATKLGYRGWYFSGQIFGHLLSIAAPMFILSTLESNKPIILKIVVLLLLAIPCLLIGTKVPYFIFIIVFALHILIMFFYKIFNHNYQIKRINIIISLCFIILSIISYKNLPVYNNMSINNSVAQTESHEENIIDQQKKDNEKLNEIERKIKEAKDKSAIEKSDLPEQTKQEEHRLLVGKQYSLWTTKSLDDLNELYAKGKLHSSDNRDRQIYFMAYKYKYSTVPFKALGLGYLNQPNQLSMERDIIMPLFSFGIIGFVLFTFVFWKKLIKTIVFATVNFKDLDMEFLALAESLCMFFFISFYAGSTYIYTQFANVLAVVLALLYVKMHLINENKQVVKVLKKITTQKYDSLVKSLDNNMGKNKKTFIITSNPETIMLVNKDKLINKMLIDDNILKVPDGIAIVKACKKYNLNINERITGCDLSVSLLELANKQKKSLYLFGAKEEVLKKLVQVIKEKYPNIKLLKAQNGYVEDYKKIKQDIIKQKPDLCLVALGIPKQEKFIYEIYNLVDKGIFMGVGGTFDVLSGTKKRAPKIFIKLNIEWLYRILKEPFRIKRFIKSNFKFIFKIFL